jgi:hypothetical protein
MIFEKVIYDLRFKYDTENEILYKKCGHTGKWLNCKILSPNDRGYLRIGCTKDYKHYSYYYHRIVYKMFNDDFDINNRKLKIDHKDRNKLNNSISNLKQVNTQENNQNTNARGIHFRKDGRKRPWVACWYEEGKQKSRNFTNKYMAQTYRNMKISKLYYLGNRQN